MPKLIKKYDSNFTILTNDLFKDKRLSYKELGLLVQLLSLPDNWEFNIKGLSKIHKDGENSVKVGLVKLEDYGYLTRVRTRDEKGHMSSSDYYIYDNPNENSVFIAKNKGFIPRAENHLMAGYSPVDENPPVVNPPVENPTNKEYIYKEINNKSTSTKSLDLTNKLTEKTNVDGMMVTDRQYNDINDMIQMIATREIKDTTKADLLKFLHKLYDEEKQEFLVNKSQPIKNLKGFITTYFNAKTDKDISELLEIKELADKGNENMREFVESHSSLYKKLEAQGY